MKKRGYFSYHFVGLPGEVVWLTFRKFEVVHHKEDIYRVPDCLNRMSLQDPATTHAQRSDGRLGEFCENSPPRLCDYSYLSSFGRGEGNFRACVGDNETYVSRGRELSLELHAGESTAVTSINFVVAYEFVDTTQEGVQMKGKDGDSGDSWSCDRVFDSESYSNRRRLQFSTPRNVFLFGRGGRTDLRCSYVFRGRAGRERVRLRMERIGHGQSGQCSSSTQHDVLPGLCSGPEDERAPRLRVYVSEVPEGSTRPVRQHCLCEALSSGDPGLSFLSNTSTLMVEFVVENMRPDQDYDDFYISGSFSFAREPSCPLNGVATGAGGEILLKRSHSCNDAPWVIRASRPGMYIFLKVTGSVLHEGRSDGRDLRNRTASSFRPRWCQTADRVYVYTGSKVTVVCPTTAGSGDRAGVGGVRSVELFSDGWDRAKLPFLPRWEERPRDSSVTVRFSGGSREGGPYLLQWMEITPDPDSRADAVAVSLDSTGGAMSSRRSSSSSSSSSCAFSCPELSGCIRAELYCDGVRHCPSGFDEREENCAHVFAPLLYMYAVAIVAVAAVICVAIVVVQRMRSRSGDVFRSNDNLNGDVDGSVVVAAYNPGVMVGVNGGGGAMYNGDYDGEVVSTLAKSASIHSNVDDSGFLVVEADIVNQG